MRQLHRFIVLPATNKRLLFRALVLVIAIRLGLTLFSYRSVRAFIQKNLPIPIAAQTEPLPAARVARLMWAIRTVSRYVPKATCLTQAIAAQVLMARHGQVALLHIGVAKSEEGKFEAHAWVEIDGQVIIGGATSERYSPLVAFDGI